MIVDVPVTHRIKARLAGDPGLQLRRMTDSVATPVPELATTDAPVALRYRNADGDPIEFRRASDGRWLERAHEGSLKGWLLNVGSILWASDSRFLKPLDNPRVLKGERLDWPPLKAGDPSVRTRVATDFPQRTALVERVAARSAVIDGVFWQPCREPAWTLSTSWPNSRGPAQCNVYIRPIDPSDLGLFFPIDQRDLVDRTLAAFQADGPIEVYDDDQIEVLDPGGPLSTADDLLGRHLKHVRRRDAMFRPHSYLDQTWDEASAAIEERSSDKMRSAFAGLGAYGSDPEIVFRLSRLAKACEIAFERAPEPDNDAEAILSAYL